MKKAVSCIFVIIAVCALAAGCGRTPNGQTSGERIVIPAAEQPYIPLVTITEAGVDSTIQTFAFSTQVLTWLQTETAEQLPYEATPETALVLRIQVTPEEEQVFYVWQKDTDTVFSLTPPNAENVDEENTFIYKVAENCYHNIRDKIL